VQVELPGKISASQWKVQHTCERSKERPTPEHSPAVAERIGGLSSLSAAELERTLSALYVSQPLRWQTFMDEAQVLIDAVSEDHSGFAQTVGPGDG
jgi:hypothetical protein